MQAFAAAVLRNPVLDLSAMIHLSDIPDWCYIEAFGSEVGRPPLRHARCIAPCFLLAPTATGWLQLLQKSLGL